MKLNKTDRIFVSLVTFVGSFALILVTGILIPTFIVTVISGIWFIWVLIGDA